MEEKKKLETFKRFKKVLRGEREKRNTDTTVAYKDRD